MISLLSYASTCSLLSLMVRAEIVSSCSPLYPVLASLDFYNNYHRLDSLWTVEIYLSQFWGLEFQDQNASMVGFQWGPPSGLQNSCVSLHYRRGERALLGSFYKNINTIPEKLHYHNLTTSQKPYLLLLRV